MTNYDTIDYSSLNKSLQPKRKINSITKDISKEIGDIFLAKNAPRSKKIEAKNQRLNEFSSNIENASENMKVKFALTIDHLAKNNLLNPESIKSLKIRGKNSDEKLQNIIEDLTTNRKTPLTEKQKTELAQAVADGIEKHYLDLAEKENNNEELKSKNEELEDELNASEAANEVVESAILSKRSINNTIRVGKAIENINNSNLDPVAKARKVLWQADTFVLFGHGKRREIFKKLRGRFDVNKKYTEAVKNLKDKMNNAKEPKEKVAIRYIMRQVNTAYKTYIDATNISEETRKQNMKDINQKIVA